jgi:hypothetical protein
MSRFGPAFLSSLIIGTLLQVAMVVIGHFYASVAALFGSIGVGISLLAGILLTIRARRQALGSSLVGAALVGGLCALIGIALSWGLGDVPALILVVGTAASTVTGALGGFLGRLGAPRAVTVRPDTSGANSADR